MMLRGSEPIKSCKEIASTKLFDNVSLQKDRVEDEPKFNSHFLLSRPRLAAHSQRKYHIGTILHGITMSLGQRYFLIGI